MGLSADSETLPRRAHSKTSSPESSSWTTSTTSAPNWVGSAMRWGLRLCCPSDLLVATFLACPLSCLFLLSALLLFLFLRWGSMLPWGDRPLGAFSPLWPAPWRPSFAPPAPRGLLPRERWAPEIKLSAIPRRSFGALGLSDVAPICLPQSLLARRLSDRERPTLSWSLAAIGCPSCPGTLVSWPSGGNWLLSPALSRGLRLCWRGTRRPLPADPSSWREVCLPSDLASSGSTPPTSVGDFSCPSPPCENPHHPTPTLRHPPALCQTPSTYRCQTAHGHAPCSSCGAWHVHRRLVNRFWIASSCSLDYAPLKKRRTCTEGWSSSPTSFAPSDPRVHPSLRPSWLLLLSVRRIIVLPVSRPWRFLPCRFLGLSLLLGNFTLQPSEVLPNSQLSLAWGTWRITSLLSPLLIIQAENVCVIMPSSSGGTSLFDFHHVLAIGLKVSFGHTSDPPSCPSVHQVGSFQHPDAVRMEGKGILGLMPSAALSVGRTDMNEELPALSLTGALIQPPFKVCIFDGYEGSSEPKPMSSLSNHDDPPQSLSLGSPARVIHLALKVLARFPVSLGSETWVFTATDPWPWHGALASASGLPHRGNRALRLTNCWLKGPYQATACAQKGTRPAGPLQPLRAPAVLEQLKRPRVNEDRNQRPTTLHVDRTGLNRDR